MADFTNCECGWFFQHSNPQKDSKVNSYKTIGIVLTKRLVKVAVLLGIVVQRRRLCVKRNNTTAIRDDVYDPFVALGFIVGFTTVSHEPEWNTGNKKQKQRKT